MSEREKIYIAMTSILHPAYIDQWLHTENPMLRYYTPSYVIRNGGAKHIWDLIESLKDVSYS